jgi:hypothetical protein
MSRSFLDIPRSSSNSARHDRSSICRKCCCRRGQQTATNSARRKIESKIPRALIAFCFTCKSDSAGAILLEIQKSIALFTTTLEADQIGTRPNTICEDFSVLLKAPLMAWSNYILAAMFSSFIVISTNGYSSSDSGYFHYQNEFMLRSYLADTYPW